MVFGLFFLMTIDDRCLYVVQRSSTWTARTLALPTLLPLSPSSPPLHPHPTFPSSHPTPRIPIYSRFRISMLSWRWFTHEMADLRRLQQNNYTFTTFWITLSYHFSIYATFNFSILVGRAFYKAKVELHIMAIAEARAYLIWGPCPQWGPEALPLVGV